MASLGTRPESTGAASASPTRTYRGPFAIMTSLFFLWGFMTVFISILIPRFKEAIELNYFKAMLVLFAYFGAYFIGSLLYFRISVTSGDPIARIGYKNGVALGLVKSALGSAVFWPAAGAESYPMFLGALLPPLQGLVAGKFSIQLSFIVPMLACACVAFYGAICHRIGRQRPASDHA